MKLEYEVWISKDEESDEEFTLTASWNEDLQVKSDSVKRGMNKFSKLLNEKGTTIPDGEHIYFTLI